MSSSLDVAFQALSYAYPVTIFSYFAISSLIAIFTLQNLRTAKNPQSQYPGRRSVISLVSIFLLTYVIQLVAIGAFSISTGQWPTQEHLVIWPLSCILVFGIEVGSFIDSPHPTWYQHIGSWALGLVFEIAMEIFLLARTNWNHVPFLEAAVIALGGCRCLLVGTLTTWCTVVFYSNRCGITTDEETQALLPKPGQENGQTQPENGTYGSTQHASTAQSGPREFRWDKRRREAREAMEKRLEAESNWFQYAKRFSIFFPYVWPMHSLRLQLRAVGVAICLLASNALNLLIPRQTGIVMDSLSGTIKADPWKAVAVFVVLRLVASEAGIDLLRPWLWAPVKYYSHEALSRAAYSHMMYLSADFHDSKSTSDMTMAIRGGSSVSSLVESLLLRTVPMVIDLVVAVVYLSLSFGAYEALVTISTGLVFLLLAGRLIANSKSQSRQRVTAMYREYEIRNAGLMGWQTVSAFNQIGYEENRHADATSMRWSEEQRYATRWYVSFALQAAVLTCGLSVSTFLAVSRIRSGKATPGQFAMLLMYWTQLSSPLRFFARLGQEMSDDFVNAERLLDVMQTKPSVESRKGARPLKFVAGEVHFEDIDFSYDKQKGVIKNVSLHIPAGQTVAFVGSTGAGKSTLLKLINRFYDVTGGTIRIDGQDIRDVDLFSLRERIGVVPQNPILFDDTIMNNVRYGKITASDEEVHEACKAAFIHDKIVEMSDGYETRVGEHGTKLSGGELQRVAIARAILKAPDMVLLDEATSAVDTDTELKIQSSFRALCAGRTTFVIAHRLSTIMNADRIVVVEHGNIIEQGPHEELLAANGRYADLWSKQVFIKPTEKKDDQLFDDTDGPSAAKISIGGPKAMPGSRKGPGLSNHQQSSTAASAAAVPQDLQEVKLNPVAATFRPRSSKGSGATQSQEGRLSSEDSTAVSTGKASTSATSVQWSDDVIKEEENTRTGDGSVHIAKTQNETSAKSLDPEA